MPMVDIDWLKEHVAVPADLSYEQLAKDLVKVGFEEEAIHPFQVTGPVVVGYVVDAVPEPQKNGKTINWCHVDVGERYNSTDESGRKVPRGIVCGAPNMAAGHKVVVTLPGAVLPGDFKIEPRKTYGHLSDGMCASERELGLGDNHDGIILLDQFGFTPTQVEALRPGDDAVHLLHLDQPVLEINITADRGYAFSYRGVAREFHHSTGAAFTDPVTALNKQVPSAAANGGADAGIEVRVEDSSPIHGVIGCDRYYARTVSNFDPDSHTPNWMRRRLIRAGMRSISLAVDVTNYVMLDLGQPMHAYDLDKLQVPIVVRRALTGEHLTTLDGKDHVLSTEDLLITDSPEGVAGSRILGIAGVMGGQYGEVTSQTQHVLLESAHFDPVSIARSARRHKIPSEASHRFERGVDDQLQPAAAQYAAALLEEFGHGQASRHPVDLNTTSTRQAIDFATTEVRRLTALPTEEARIASLLEDIGCVLEPVGNERFRVTPPSWRPDLQEPCDLVEEVARLVGYDEIPVTVPAAPVRGHVGLQPAQRHRREVADELAEYGLVETLSYPFVGSADFKAFSYDESELEPVSVAIANPLAADRPYLRRSVLLTLARTVQRNIRRGIENVALYEIGHVYWADPDAPAIPALPGAQRPTDEQLAALDAGLPRQPEHVAAILTGLAEHDGWLGHKRAVDFSDAVEAVGRIGDRLGANLVLHALDDPQEQPQWHPGRVAQILAAGQPVGIVGELHPHVNQSLGFPEHSAAFELDLTRLFATLHAEPVQVKPVSTFPPVKQDLAFTVSESVNADELTAAIVAAASESLEHIELFDVFVGEPLADGFKSLAYAVTLRSPDRTLSSGDIESIRSSIVEGVAVLGAQLRA